MQVARQHPGDFRVDIVALLLQLGDAPGRVRLAALVELLEQIEQRQQARLGADELPLRQLHQPDDGLFGGRRQVELWFIGARAVELAQPALVRRCPVTEVFQRRPGKGRVAQRLTHRIELIFQGLGQSAAAIVLALGTTNTRCRKLAISAAWSERNSRHAG